MNYILVFCSFSVIDFGCINSGVNENTQHDAEYNVWCRSKGGSEEREKERFRYLLESLQLTFILLGVALPPLIFTRIFIFNRF